MGCDIHCFAEKKNEDGSYSIVNGFKPFKNRHYCIFSFLAGVRNYYNIVPISIPRGLPEDVSAEVKNIALEYENDSHSYSWLTIKELSEFDYTKKFEYENEFYVKTFNTSYSEYLGENYFNELKKLQESGVDRIVFFFDN